MIVYIPTGLPLREPDFPQMFFDCLRERISGGAKKKRLPNSTISFIRKDALPLGSFTKHTWIITNVLHVKQIFDTPHLPLEITRLQLAQSIVR